MSNNVKDRRSLIKKLNSKRIYLFGKDDKKYKEEYDNAEFIEQMNMLWKFIARISLK